jgi:hypothetical protein
MTTCSELAISSFLIWALPGNPVFPNFLVRALDLVHNVLGISKLDRRARGRFVGAIAVSALTTPALAATEAGAFALPHGEHSEVQPAEVGPAELNLQSHLGH